jgi:cation transport regulator ChaC
LQVFASSSSNLTLADTPTLLNRAGYASIIWRPDIDFVESHEGYVRGFVRRFWQASPDHRGTPASLGRVCTLVPFASIANGVRNEQADSSLPQPSESMPSGHVSDRRLHATAGAVTVAELVGSAESPHAVAAAPEVGTTSGTGTVATGKADTAGDDAPAGSASGRTGALAPLPHGAGLASAEVAEVHGTVYRLRPATRADTVAKLWHREKAGYSCLRVAVCCSDGVTREAYTFAATRANPYWVGHETPLQLAAIIATSVGPSGPNLEYFSQLLAAMRARGVHDPHLEELHAHIAAHIGASPAANEASESEDLGSSDSTRGSRAGE